MPHALVVESGHELRERLRLGLGEKYLATMVATAQEALALLRQTSVALDVVVLSAALPDMSGCDLCREIRRLPWRKGLPVIFISGERDMRGLVAAFDAGADDFIFSPFAPEELTARVGAKLRRQSPDRPRHDLFWKADLRFSVGTHRVVITNAEGERDLGLTPNEFKILYYLAAHEGRVLSRRQILAEVWGENLHVEERTVDRHVWSLRRKLGRRSYYVVSIPGEGYVFSLPQVDLPL